MQLGWIDFSKTERSKILSVLDLLQENGTLDELGIAPVRDGFSNIFFPGTSTIQTRAKYFLIVPYALKDLERSNETNPNVLHKKLDAIERSCGEQLLANNKDERGTIKPHLLPKNLQTNSTIWVHIAFSGHIHTAPPVLLSGRSGVRIPSGVPNTRFRSRAGIFDSTK